MQCFASSSVAISGLARAEAPAEIVCPAVMATRVDKAAHPGWLIYSNEPLRLTGIDIEYIVNGHIEATLDPDLEERLNDESLSNASIFRLTAHRKKEPFALICLYGVHAQLRREIPRNMSECKVVQHGIFTEVEFEASCH